LSDLSGLDSEDDSFYVNSIHSPSDSYLNQPDDNLIERRLENIFGIQLDEDQHETPHIEAQPISTDDLLANYNYNQQIKKLQLN
jgi:hypothetical protein